jgi:hypothetical protein
MLPSQPTPVKSKHRIRLFIACLALALTPAIAFAANDSVAPSAAQTGSISGRVQNVATGAYLEGASVALEPGRQTTLTSRDGSFYFSSVPAGDYRISVSYTGLDRQEFRLGWPQDSPSPGMSP